MHKLNVINWCGRITLLAVLLTAPAMAGTYSENKVIKVSAITQTSPPKVTLSWPLTSGGATYIVVYRKSKDAFDWGAPHAVLSGSATKFDDTSVALGAAYEYRLFQDVPGDSYPADKFGYIYAGVRVPLVENRGSVVLLVDNTQASALASKLDRLEDDLAGDGWKVLRHDVSPSASVPYVKNLIRNAYYADPANVKAVFLLGHIPVPYAGNIAWDGHSNHKGAWPADIFYGDINGIWTDNAVNNSSATRPENHNVPGDGKYDNSIVPSRVELMVGRVDFQDMPAFSLSETQLLAQYLDKDHDFRHGRTTVQNRALVEDNLQSLPEGASQPAWRFSSLVGAQNVKPADWSTLTTNSYLLGYGCGGSGYTNVGGIASTSDFSKESFRVIFQLLFGSYFADWDNRNNALRAAIAGPTYGLTSAWGTRPNWYLHHMGLGEPIGTGYLASTEILPYSTSFGGGSVHVSMMGDPTLRLSYMRSPSNLNAVSSGTRAKLSWTSSPDSQTLGYNVYRASSAGGRFTRLNGNLITGTSYSDSDPLSGTSTYMVRAVRLETSPSGTYYNGSQGIFKTYSGGTAATPPPVPSITTDGGSGPGADFVTTASSLILRGTCDNSLVTVTVNGSTNGVNYAPGSTDWQYTHSLDMGQNSFSVRGTNGQGLTSGADSITVTLEDAGTPPTGGITVLGPNGGETLYRDTSQTISWASSSAAGSHVKILVRTGNSTGVVAGSTPNDGTYQWQVPSQIPLASNFIVEISSASNPGIFDQSDDHFTISDATQPASDNSITVTSPNGGETIVRGSQTAITWSSTGQVGSHVRIYVQRGTSSANLTTSTPNDGHFDWTVPNFPEGPGYIIRIRSLDFADIDDSSDTDFSLADTPETGGYLTVTAPNGGETLARGQNAPIRWTDTGQAGSHVTITVHHGSYSSVIAGRTPNDGYFNWSVPPNYPVGSGYTIEVTSEDHPSISDTSDSDFSLAE